MTDEVHLAKLARVDEVHLRYTWGTLGNNGRSKGGTLGVHFAILAGVDEVRLGYTWQNRQDQRRYTLQYWQDHFRYTWNTLGNILGTLGVHLAKSAGADEI